VGRERKLFSKSNNMGRLHVLLSRNYVWLTVSQTQKSRKHGIS